MSEQNNSLFGELLSKLQEDNKGERPWEKEWQGMPEFVQNDLTAQYQVIVSFRTFEDLKAFAQLVGQKITVKTQSIWYPKADLDIVKNLRYTDE